MVAVGFPRKRRRFTPGKPIRIGRGDRSADRRDIGKFPDALDSASPRVVRPRRVAAAGPPLRSEPRAPEDRDQRPVPRPGDPTRARANERPDLDLGETLGRKQLAASRMRRQLSRVALPCRGAESADDLVEFEFGNDGLDGAAVEPTSLRIDLTPSPFSRNDNPAALSITGASAHQPFSEAGPEALACSSWTLEVLPRGRGSTGNTGSGPGRRAFVDFALRVVRIARQTRVRSLGAHRFSRELIGAIRVLQG